MLNIKRAATAAVCAAGITAGAVAMATPAAAATATANYNCGSYGSSVKTTFNRTGTDLTVTANISFFVPISIPAGGIQGNLVGNQSGLANPNPLPPGLYSSIQLKKSGSIGIPSAPSSIVLTITPPGISVTCTLISGTASGFPV
jgi:hypothetical protein